MSERTGLLAMVQADSSMVRGGVLSIDIEFADSDTRLQSNPIVSQQPKLNLTLIQGISFPARNSHTAAERRNQ
ncbi:MAG: hypothetical protein LBG99_05265 [Propionibacteriaceae bacterium]|jgi:hypothetical protein|nr:hypothetical protein [Propionibacteriaceae bacterium]